MWTVGMGLSSDFYWCASPQRQHHMTFVIRSVLQWALTNIQAVCRVVFNFFLFWRLRNRWNVLLCCTNQACAHTSITGMFSVWLCFCTEKGRTDLTGVQVFLSFFFFLKQPWLLFWFRQEHSETKWTWQVPKRTDGMERFLLLLCNTKRKQCARDIRWPCGL